MKNIRLFSIIATLLLTFAPVAAQMNVGGWKIHPIFGKDVQNIIDTGKMLYYLVNSNLYCYCTVIFIYFSKADFFSKTIYEYTAHIVWKLNMYPGLFSRVWKT